MIENLDSLDGSADDPAANEAPKSPLVIVFTDIVKSTALWEQDSEAMSVAMTIHDNLIRDLAGKYEGYEVKQNGDGFMFAFPEAVSALDFCLEVQLQLQEQDWPPHLLELGPAKLVVGTNGTAHDASGISDEVVLWKGLKLRMAAHFGAPVCKWNQVIKRMDYLGPTVNRAARFISVCEAGQIVVSDEFLTALKQAREEVHGDGGPLFDGHNTYEVQDCELDLKELQPNDMVDSLSDTEVEIRMLGERHFKGVSGTQRLYFIVPKSLRGRLNYSPKHKFVQASKGNLTDNGA